MSLFTINQYNQAIENLKLARQQLVENTQSKGCSICGGNCHPDQCGRNPLYAMMLCVNIDQMTRNLHDQLHHIILRTHMGEAVGFNSIILPEKDELTANKTR